MILFGMRLGRGACEKLVRQEQAAGDRFVSMMPIGSRSSRLRRSVALDVRDCTEFVSSSLQSQFHIRDFYDGAGRPEFSPRDKLRRSYPTRGRHGAAAVMSDPPRLCRRRYRFLVV
jgi:hypothetical protein